MKRGQNISYEVLSFLVLLSGVNYSLVLYSHIIIDAKYISNYIKICENIYKAVTIETVRKWIKAKAIPCSRMGKLWKFKKSEVDEWVKSGGAAEERND